MFLMGSHLCNLCRLYNKRSIAFGKSRRVLRNNSSKTSLHILLRIGQCAMAKVKIEQGWLEGEQLEVITGDGQYYSFKGIPYATPPLGKLKFKAPLPPQPWDGVRKATEHGPICHQIDIFTNETVPGKEDCLYLNVYTPDLNPASPLTVMVFIHGGGYNSGSGNDDFYSPDFLVQHNIVLVTINYRLGALGFLCLDTKEVPGNAGMKDQVAALKWVKQNIANFGGDPNNITIFGESAGGASVSMHIVSPMSKGLFNRAISMSGVSTCDWSLSFEPRKRAFALGKLFSIDTEDADELLELLQNIPVEDLITKKPYILASEEITVNIMKNFSFNPVVEKDFGQERFLTHPTTEALENIGVNVDVMIGYTDAEGLIAVPMFESTWIDQYRKYNELLVPWKILCEASPTRILEVSDIIKRYYFGNKPLNHNHMKEFLKYANDATFAYRINEFARILSLHSKNNVYFYQYSCVSERNFYGKLGTKYGLSGTSHLDDIMYLFHSKKLNIPIVKDSPTYKMIQHTCSLFTNFAKFGTPTPEPIDGVTWPLYDSTTQKYLDIGEKLVPGEFLNVEIVEFWKKVYEIAGVTM